jgi:hypothetical protein
MIKLLGIFDILASVMLFLSLLNLKWSTLLIIFMIYLFLKGVIFTIMSFDIASIIDIFSSVIMLLLLFFAVPQALVVLAGVLLLQKGIFSLF